MKRSLLMLACGLLFALTLTVAIGAYAFVPGSDAVLYVNGTGGNDTNDGLTPATALATPGAAHAKLTEGGTIVVSGATSIASAYTPAATSGAVLYTSVYGGTDYRTSGAALSIGANMAFAGDTYFDDIDLHITKSTLVFSGKHHNFGFGAGVTCQNSTTTTFKYPLIYGGVNTPTTLSLANSDASYTLTVAGGTWNGLGGGNRRTSNNHALGTLSGDVKVYIEGGTFIGEGDYVSAGGSNYHTGRLYMEITGGEFRSAVYGFRRLHPIPADTAKDTHAENATQAVIRIAGGEFAGKISTYAANDLGAVPVNLGDLTFVITGGNFASTVTLENQGVLGTTLIRCSAAMEATLRPLVASNQTFLFSNDLTAATAGSETAHFAGALSSKADPFVFEKDGMYYCAVPNSTSTGVRVAASRELSFSNFTYNSKQVFDSASGTTIANAKKEYWAPEIHYFSADEVGASNAGWYIYVAADDGSDANHRMYVLRASDPTDAQSDYTMVGELETDGDLWAIDGTVLKYGGKLYFVWSGHPESGSTQQIYIQEMESPSKMKAGARTLLATPSESWERRNTPLLEGPQALVLNGTVHILYSANGSWTRRYCLGMLTLVGSDPLNANGWQKSDSPVFEMSEENAMFGTGHASFVQNSLDNTYWIYYHAVPDASVKDGNDANGTPVFWQARRSFAQQFTTETKTVGSKTLTYPVFGAPIAASAMRNATIHTPDACADTHLYGTDGETCLICRYTASATKPLPSLRYDDMNDDGKIDLIDALLLVHAVLTNSSDATLVDVVKLLGYIALA